MDVPDDASGTEPVLSGSSTRSGMITAVREVVLQGNAAGDRPALALSHQIVSVGLLERAAVRGGATREPPAAGAAGAPRIRPCRSTRTSPDSSATTDPKLISGGVERARRSKAGSIRKPGLSSGKVELALAWQLCQSVAAHSQELGSCRVQSRKPKSGSQLGNGI